MDLKRTVSTIIKTSRPPFLALSPVCIFLSYGTAVASGAMPEKYLLWLVFLGAISAHISVNTFNEYFDFLSGLDSLTERTPFSGGSGALQDDPEAAPMVLHLAQLTLAITVLLGIYFIYLRGLSLLVLLIIGVTVILTYTKWLNRQPLLCLIAPGLSFGILYVIGSHVVLAGHYHKLAIYVSLVPFLLTNNLLLLNQYPDINADSSVGRRHFPIVYGIRLSNRVYTALACLTVMVIVFGVYAAILPGQSLFALLPMLLVIVVLYGINRYADNIEKLLPYLGINVFISLATPTILGVSLLTT